MVAILWSQRIYSFSFNEATGQLAQVGYVQVKIFGHPAHST